MTFLNSILLWGGLAVSIPIIIHFLNRRKFKKVSWAAMKFVRISVDQNQRRMKLEDLLLLLIRCAIVALLALALARPALTTGDSVMGAAPVSSVVVMDNSFSMDLKDNDDQTAFEQARLAAKATLDALPSGSSASFLLASDRAQDVIEVPTFDLNQVKEEIDRARVSNHSTDMLPALKRAVDILGKRSGVQKEIYVITDGQKSGWSQENDIAKLVADAKADKVQVHFIRVGQGGDEAGTADNLAITRMDVADGLTPINRSLKIDVEVANYFKADKSVRVGLFVDGSESPVDSLEINVPGENSQFVSLYTQFKEKGFHTVRAALLGEAGDRLEADNENRLVVRAVDKVKVMLVDGAPTDGDGESFFLNVLFNGEPDHYTEATVETPAGFTSGGLDPEDITAIFFTNVPSLTGDQVKALENYLRAGGGVFFFPGNQVDVGFYNDTLHAKHGILPSEWGAAQGDASSDEKPIFFQSGGFEHPVSALWNNPELKDLRETRTYQYLALSETAAKGAKKVTEAGPSEVVLRYKAPDGKAANAGPPAVMERKWGAGRVFQFSSTADTDWTNLPIRAASVLPLVYRMVGSVQSNRDSNLNLRAGQPFQFVLQPGETDKKGKVSFEVLAQTNEISAQQINDLPVLEFADTHQAGFYTFELQGKDGGETRQQFVVKHDTRESDLTMATDAEISATGNLINWKTTADFNKALSKNRFGAEYWFLIFLGILALVGLETYLAQKFSQAK